MQHRISTEAEEEGGTLVAAGGPGRGEAAAPHPSTRQADISPSPARSLSWGHASWI
jgi:hypothetical protein